MRPRNLLVLGWLALIGLMAPGAAGQVLEEGDIVVSDRGAGSVIRIRPGGSPEPTLIESGFSSLRGILADDFGSVFLTESVSDHVLHLDPDTGVIGIVTGPPYASVFAVPEEIVFDEFGDLLVADASLTVWGPGVVRLDPVVGDPEIVYPEPMAPQGDFTLGFPEGLALDLGSETLYVTDTTTAEPGVYKIDLALPLEDRTLEPVSLHGGFVTPKDVALEPGGTLLVADRFAGPNYETGIVFRVDPTVAPDPEAPLGGNQSIVVENLQAPVGLHVYPSGDFLVADFGAGAILRYDENGVYQPGGSYSGDPLVGPWRITVVGPLTSRGDFLVADTEQQPEPELYRLSFDPADPAAATRTEEPHVMSFEAPAGVAVDTDGTPLVCDGDETTQDQSLFRVTQSDPIYDGLPFEQPNRVVVHELDGKTWYFVADPVAGAILKVEDGAAERLEPDDGPNYLVEPVALAIDQDGLLVVLNRDVEIETPEDRAPLLRVNPENGFQNPLPLVPAVIEEIVAPVDLAIDANDQILLADAGDPAQEKNPVIFRLDGLSGAVQQKGYGSLLFHRPEGIALDVNRELLVTDSGDPDADPPIEPAVIRVDTTAATMSTVEIDAGSWSRPNGVALAQTADPPALADLDGDAVADRFDNCESDFNPGQEDVNADGIGDLCQPDDPDGDGWPADEDNCQGVANRSQVDTNADGIGNRCDADYDNDGLVGGGDFVLLSQAWRATPGDPRYNPDIDLNPEDEVPIGGNEFILLSAGWGQSPGPGLPGCDGTTIPCPVP